jgi:hypothetical protein
MILGLLGPAGSGKSTVAEHLRKYYGAAVYSFARPLKEIARRALDFSTAQVYGSQAEKEAVDPRYGFSPRWFLQRLGTEGIRQVLGADFWVRLCLDDIAKGGARLAVIEDVRFISESDAIRAAGGAVIRLDNPGRVTNADASHASESECSRAPYDYLIGPSERGVDELLRLVDETMCWGVEYSKVSQ